MNSYQRDLQDETAYLEKVVALLNSVLAASSAALALKKTRLVGARKEMWENTVPFTNDFTRLTEISQYLSEINRQTADYSAASRQLERCRRSIASPYFGRIDFQERGSKGRERIYIGLANVTDAKTGGILVHDWRAPIAGIFYQFELGEAAYEAPAGVITGDVTLKRQYRIQNARLKYFFDCGIVINDEILQEALSRNASPRMRHIVETIQKEQDLIIRDTGNELLIVQGVAGSGKTSIALHRIAFLLYNGLNSNLDARNFLIISPNNAFSQYISGVLPELGEENVAQTTFDGIVASHLGGRLRAETRNAQLESLILRQGPAGPAPDNESIAFKGSRAFVRILDRLLLYYGRRLIPFDDVSYDGRIILTGQLLKQSFLGDRSGAPMARRLQRIEKMILERIHPLQKSRLEKIERIVAAGYGHELEVKSFSRLLAIREAQALMRRLRRFTRVDYVDIYRTLFRAPGLFFKLARGIELPENAERMVMRTGESLASGIAPHEDCAPLVYLKLRVEDGNLFEEIRQVVIDEAQDYYPLQYEVFKLLFKYAGYTILGDTGQAIEKDADLSLYDTIAGILDKERAVRLSLNRAYRSTAEINAYTRRLLGDGQDPASFERHGARPAVIHKSNQDLVIKGIAREIERRLAQGYESIAVICKTQRQARAAHAGLKALTGARLVMADEGAIEKGVLVIPAYMAKGLEFDAVIIHDASSDNYSSELDRKLLYIACTRALHRLTLYHTGETSPLLPR